MRDRGSLHGTVVNGLRVGAGAAVDVVPLAAGENDVVAGPARALAARRASPYRFLTFRHMLRVRLPIADAIIPDQKTIDALHDALTHVKRVYIVGDATSCPTSGYSRWCGTIIHTYIYND